MSTETAWAPDRPIIAPQTPNQEAVARGLQSEINRQEIKAQKERTGAGLDALWDQVQEMKALPGGFPLYEGTVNSLVAPSGAGKSLWLLAAAAAIAQAGRPVVVLATEHAITWHLRYATWCQVYNGGAKLDNFHIVNEDDSRAYVADPEVFIYELKRRRIVGALIVLDTIGASGVDVAATNPAKYFLVRMQRVATDRESCVLFSNHEYVNGKQVGNAVLHNNIGNRLRLGVLSDGTRELSCDRDRYGAVAPSPVRYRLGHTANGSEYLMTLGAEFLPESRLRAELQNYVALSTVAVTGQQVARGLGLTLKEVSPDLTSLVRSGHLTQDESGAYLAV